MLPKVITLAEVHDREGELFEPLLDMYDLMEDQETPGEETDEASERDEGNDRDKGDGRKKGRSRHEGSGEEEFSNESHPASVPAYFISHVEHTCSKIGNIALDELVSGKEKLATLKSLLDALEGTGLNR
jgi:hypothetical protein